MDAWGSVILKTKHETIITATKNNKKKVALVSNSEREREREGCVWGDRRKGS